MFVCYLAMRNASSGPCTAPVGPSNSLSAFNSCCGSIGACNKEVHNHRLRQRIYTLIQYNHTYTQMKVSVHRSLHLHRETNNSPFLNYTHQLLPFYTFCICSIMQALFTLDVSLVYYVIYSFLNSLKSM